MRTYGRSTIYLNYTEKELLSLSTQDQIDLIISNLPQIIEIHENNKTDSNYLWEYYLGKQDILEKEKQTRKDINNKKVENWAYATVDFKKSWLLGRPIQYTMLDSSSSNEIELLNKYCSYENKASKDQFLYEDILVVGRGFRFIQKDNKTEDDEAPFSIINIDNDKCEVIYSSKIGNEQLFSVVETVMMQLVPKKDTLGKVLLNEDGKELLQPEYYSEYEIYLRNKSFTITMKNGQPEYVEGSIKYNVLNLQPIKEWYVNRNRISLIELGKDIFDGINQLESLDFDDMQQFVNAIMVFTNADVDKEGLDAIKELGAVKIKSTENRKASVSLLEQRLNASDTQVFYTRLLTSLHSILGIPMQSDNGSVTSGDTGRAKLTGQGFTSAGIRLKSDETMIKDCDKASLKNILKICRETNSSKIKKLKTSDIEAQIDMDKSENLLVKAQGLQTLLSANIPKEYAVPVVNLFNDSTAVVNSMKQNEEDNKKNIEMQQKQNINNAQILKNKNINQDINQQNNKVNNIMQKAEQDM